MENNQTIYRTRYSPKSDNIENCEGHGLELVNIKKKLIEEQSVDRVVIDLCCGSGQFTKHIAPIAKEVISIDFAENMLSSLREWKERESCKKVKVILRDARATGIDENCAQFLYCFSALYTIEKSNEVFTEIYRVLKKDGVAWLELGNRRSLSKILNDHHAKHSGWAKLYVSSIDDQLKFLQNIGFKIEQRRSFQLLPMMGTPKRLFFLFPLLTKIWQVLFLRKIKGVMLDEVISSLPLIRMLSFRHLVKLRK